MIMTRGLVKRFGKHTAVAGVDLEVLQGETFGLLGPNGAGKSTTIAMIAGLLAPDSGSVKIGDAAPNTWQAKSHLGLVPQSLALYDELTATENLNFFADMYGLNGTQKRQRVQECLSFAGLTDRARDRVTTFSGGMKRRLNMAIALLHQPRLLILDEPTVGVDPQSRNHIFDSLEQLQAAGLTLLYTSHYMEEVERLCDRVAIMDHGKILAVGTLEELITKHAGLPWVRAEVSHVPSDVSLPAPLKAGRLEFRAADPLQATQHLAQRGVEFRAVTMAQPNLEEVFLTLTGRQLRDTAG